MINKANIVIGFLYGFLIDAGRKQNNVLLKRRKIATGEN